MLPPNRRALVSSALSLFALVALAASTGCSRAPQGPPPLRVGMVTSAAEDQNPALDASAVAGLEAAKRILGAEIELREGTTHADIQAALTLLADLNEDDVFAVGPALGADVGTVARHYPRRNFGLIGAISGEPNVSSVVFREAEGAFLAGALAGLAAKAHPVALAGAARDEAARDAFEAGEREVGAAASVRVAPLAQASDALAVVRANGGTLGRAVVRADLAVLQIAADAQSQKLPGGPVSDGLAEGAIELRVTARARAAIGAAGLERLARLHDAIVAKRIVPPRSKTELAAFKPVAL